MPPFQEIGVQALAAKLRSSEAFILMDVREVWEVETVRIQDTRLLCLPMSGLAKTGLRALPESLQDKTAEVLVLCHHGTRSAQVAGWLTANGWARAFSVSGGIDDYARKVDPSVGTY